ncbi:MAG: hypothetical protein IPL43_15175 [Micropruina sp.]|nr:hypothetical protein [Micropruina sp.]
MTSEHIAGIPVRNRQLVGFYARHCAVVVHTCVPADPASKGGTESSVRIAKKLIWCPPRRTCSTPTTRSPTSKRQRGVQRPGERPRLHRITRRLPVDMLTEERLRLHPVAAAPFTVAFGTTRRVPANTPMVAFEYGQYSVPHALMGAVGVRCGSAAEAPTSKVIITHVGDAGPVEVARHTPGDTRHPEAQRFPLPGRP